MADMNESKRAFLAANSRGVLTTLKRDGRPQLSNIVYWSDGSTVQLSVTGDRAKTRNAMRDPRVSLHVTDDGFGRYVVAEGTAVLVPVERPRDEAGLQLEEVYRQVSGGEHPDWDEFHQAMVDERRVLMSFAIEHLYGTA